MSDKKMTGKASKEGAVDLTALMNFAKKANSFSGDDDTEAAESASKPLKPVKPTQTIKPAPKTHSAPSQRVSKGKKEKTQRPVVLNFRLSEAEMAKLKKKAGLVSISVIVRQALKDQDLI